jgi:hypothetical protein
VAHVRVRPFIKDGLSKMASLISRFNGLWVFEIEREWVQFEREREWVQFERAREWVI